MYQSVAWERPKDFKKEIQCKRCQRWGHMARNCARQYCCVKCQGDHGQVECPVSKDKESKAFCIN